MSAAVAGPELRIIVADEGGGLQPTADRPGLGLGLTLISKVCDTMSIVPRPAGGIEVRIVFKLAVALPAEDAPVAPAAAELGIGLPDPLSAVPAAPLPD